MWGFPKNTNKHFKETKTVNSDIIHRQARGEPPPSKEHLQEYQTVSEKEISQYSKPDQKKCVSSAIKADWKDLHLENSTILRLFKN